LRGTQRELRRARATLSDVHAELADIVLDDGDALLARFDRLRTEKFDAVRIRVHGDLHLGQVLWTGHDVVFIDFEGEPGRPIGERTIKRSPLNDAAGIVRSLDYAGRVAVDAAFDRGRVSSTATNLLDTWRRQWTARAQSTFLDRYYAEVGSPYVPSDPEERAIVLDAYTVTKALYEVRYELSHRPQWVGWPLSAVAELVSGRAPTGTGSR
jgi:maltose alpha-D-glucosyltransferase/alpha-amylase